MLSKDGFFKSYSQIDLLVSWFEENNNISWSWIGFCTHIKMSLAQSTNSVWNFQCQSSEDGSHMFSAVVISDFKYKWNIKIAHNDLLMIDKGYSGGKNLSTQ